MMVIVQYTKVLRKLEINSLPTRTKGRSCASSTEYNNPITKLIRLSAAPSIPTSNTVASKRKLIF